MSRFVLTAQLQLQAPNNVSQVVRQIQNQLSGVTINVQVQGSAQAQRQIQQITNQTNQCTSAATRMGRAFAVSIRRFAAFSIATRAVGLFTSTLSDAVQTAIDFERQLIKVSQVTGKSVSQLSDLTGEITRLSTSLGVSSQSLLDVSTILAQAGLTAEDTKVALNSLARAALAPNFDSITETAEGAIAILAQFKEGVGALEGQLGSINAVAGAFAVEASDLIDVIRRTGGVFKSSGGNLNELLALFTSVRATTRESAESIGTGLRTIFTRIQRPKTIEYLKRFGIELVDLEGKFVGPFEAVRKLSGALAGLEEGDITFIQIAEELGGFRQIGKVLPLLQQFATAQAALNVATNAGNSLSSDAASAQAALAIKIMKVKEEFLALVRSITETSTFQVMANTALQLASALIKIADAIKPLLPMLAALAAIRMARGIGSFAGAMMGGLTSGRTFNKGGKVHAFARGGMVPGTGNRDTVPAMLSPGEFVIRKSSVQKLGAGTLHAMNENRYEKGGLMTTAQKLDMARGPQKTQSLAKKDKKAKYTSGRDEDELRFSVANGNIGAFFMNKEGTPDGLKPFKSKSFNITNPKLLSLAGVKPYKNKGDRMAGKPDTFSAKGILEAGNIQTFYPSIGDIKSGSLSQIIQNNVKTKLSEAVASVANEVSSKKLLDIPPIDSNDALLSVAAKRIQSDAGAIRTTSGYLYEGVIDALTGARPASGNAVFDFPASSLQGNRKRLAALFGNEPAISSLKQADAKASYSSKIIDGDMGSGSISSKIVNSINGGILAGINIKKKFLGGIIQKFAIGGRAKGMQGAPLIDDMINASGTVMPRPSSAIAALISAGGGAIDIDRTLKRTIGDKAYGMAKTSGQQSAALDKFFRDPQARLRDVTSAPLTAFGKELQTTIKSGQLSPGKLSIISKSQRVPGVAEYLNKLFGIPLANMIFTSGGSKQPAMDALRSKGPRASRVARFAAGGDVGTDTIPALLTPGEFVINRKSAQNIGYGVLNRMNKVGRYAKGGVVQRFNAGGTAQMPDARSRYSSGFVGSGGLDSSQNLIPFDMLNTQAKALAQTQQQLTAATQQTRRSMLDVVSSNKMFAASMVTSLIQGFLPAVDENSGVLLKMSHGALQLITTLASVGFALEMFGVNLSLEELTSLDKMANRLGLVFDGLYGSIKNVITGQATEAAASTASATADTAEAAASASATSADLAEASASNVAAASSFGKSLGAMTIGLTAGYLAVKAFSDAQRAALETMKKSAVESGDVEAAKKAGAKMGGLDTIETLQNIGTVLGGLAGGAAAIFSGVGAVGVGAAAAGGAVAGGAVGRGVGNRIVSQDTINAAAMDAGAAAQFVKTNKILEKASDKAAAALNNVEAGTMSLRGALDSLAVETQASVDAIKLGKEANAAEEKVVNKQTTGGLRTFGAYATLGYVDSNEEIQQKKNKMSERTQQAQRIGQQQLNVLQPMMRQQMRTTAISGGDFHGFLDSLSETEFELLNLTDDGMKNAYQAFVNITKEIEISTKALQAMNLGLRGPEATATAMSASLNKFAAGLEVGGNQFVNNAQFLSDAMSSAAQAMDGDEIKSATKNVKDNLLNMGVSENYANKFEANTNAFVQAQQNYNQAFKNVTSDIKSKRERGLSPDTSPMAIKEAFAKELTAGLKDDAKLNLTDIIKGIDLDGDDIEKILAGDLSVFGDKLTEAGKKQFEQIMKIAEERQKAEKVIIDLTKQRIDAERNYVDSVKQAIDLRLEGRELQGKYGGKQVTMEERRAAIVDKSNAGAKWLGLSKMSSNATTQDFARRRKEIRDGFAGIEDKRRQEGGMSGATGVEMDEKQKELNAAVKDQIQTIRDLVKLEEENLRLVQEKNKLEKQSLESLVNGDIEKFFEQQAAVGATAAIATGNQDLMNAFGGQALGAAYSDIQRQQEAGVQTLYGRQLAGQGGLVEQSAGAALGARGITNPLMMQQLAGTTPEEEASRARLRELGGELGNLGQLGQDMAAMQVDTATMNVNNATIELAKVEERGRQAAAGMARGGVVYASRGIFVPRGTDTVPAMLTPGEFVVNRNAVNRGNNLQILRAMNGNSSPSAAASVAGGSQALSRGGSVQYLSDGGMLGGLLGGSIPDVISGLSQALSSFVSQMSENIKALQNTKFQVTLDSTNINVNVSGMTAGITDAVKEEIAQKVAAKIRNNYSVGQGGKLTENTSTLPK